MKAAGGAWNLEHSPTATCQPPAPIDLIYVSGLYMNVTNLAAYETISTVRNGR